MIWEKKQDLKVRKDGPASIGYYEDGSIRYESYYLEGKPPKQRRTLLSYEGDSFNAHSA